ncbi:MAG TPA: T9SS type A sorting domain-containing protein, partial [Bacteroidia bacterium]|nr:T9SS type A sorting domain-containing protein [Bacteroidia bacterium]
GELYVGGRFEYAGGILANRIAKWSPIAGIEMYSPDNRFNFFPNPVSSQLSFSFPETENYFLTIKNTLGETILIKSVTEKEFSVDVKDFPSGIYFVTVTDDPAISGARMKNVAVKKFVKM